MIDSNVHPGAEKEVWVVFYRVNVVIGCVNRFPFIQRIKCMYVFGMKGEREITCLSDSIYWWINVVIWWANDLFDILIKMEKCF